MNVHSYTRRKPVHGMICRGTIENESASETRAPIKLTAAELAPRKAGTLLCAALESCVAIHQTKSILEISWKIE